MIEQEQSVIRNATVYTVNSADDVLPRANIVVRDGKIFRICVGDVPGLTDRGTIIDATGKVVFPGFVNTHIHIFQSLLKGLGADHRLIEWLNLSALPYGERMGPDLQYAAARLASMEAIQSGCTTLCESFYTTQDDELAHAVIRGMGESGIRSVFIRTFCDTGTDYGMPACFMEPVSRAMKKTEDLRLRYDGISDMLRIWTGPCVTWATTKEGYIGMLEYAKSVGMPYSMHLDETDVDNKMCREHYGQDAVALLDSVGFLGEDFLAVHCVNLTDREIEVFAERGVCVSHNPMANMYLGSGFARIPEMLKKGIRVAMGTDGAASNNTTNFLESFKMASVTQKALHRDASVLSARQVLRMATIEGAKAIKLDRLIGSLEEGKKADLFIFNPHQLTSFPMHDPLATLAYSSTIANIETTMIDGKIVYDKGTFAGNPDLPSLYADTESRLRKIRL